MLWDEMEMRTYISKFEAALRPFAEMDRAGNEDNDLNEVACQRGCSSDMTLITSRDFRTAALLLEAGK